MNKEIIAEVHIMGKQYQIKCFEHEVSALKEAAKSVETCIQNVRQKSAALNLEKVIVVSAINLAYQLQTIKNQHNDLVHNVHDKLHELQNKIESSLATKTEMELCSIE